MGESTVARESTVGESTVASAGIQSLLNLLFNMAEDQAHRGQSPIAAQEFHNSSGFRTIWSSCKIVPYSTQFW